MTDPRDDFYDHDLTQRPAVVEALRRRQLAMIQLQIENQRRMMDPGVLNPEADPKQLPLDFPEPFELDPPPNEEAPADPAPPAPAPRWFRAAVAVWRFVRKVFP